MIRSCRISYPLTDNKHNEKVPLASYNTRSDSGAKENWRVIRSSPVCLVVYRSIHNTVELHALSALVTPPLIPTAHEQNTAFIKTSQKWFQKHSPGPA